ncbi:MAPEG family protein [Patescibacteria group bacterium]|nr:MAPEG family protein [Patescibacteria group bacterium]
MSIEIPITLITTGILGLLFFVHSLRTIQGRTLTKTNLGDGGHDLMTRRIRIHGNFAEYVPFLIFILFMLEIKNTPTVIVGVFAAALVVGRLLHFYGLYSKETPGIARIAGMQLTLWPLVLGSTYLLYLGLF